MQILQSGVPLTIEWTLEAPGLSAAIKVYDDTGVTPVLVSTIPMLNWFGNSYRAQFTGADNKLYVVSKAVYTDPGTYLDIDDNYAQGSESFSTIPVESTTIDKILQLLYLLVQSIAIRAKVKDNQKINVRIQDQPVIRATVK